MHKKLTVGGGNPPPKQQQKSVPVKPNKKPKPEPKQK
jgi:hypothetical protein